jgi:hypothetical protein
MPSGSQAPLREKSRASSGVSLASVQLNCALPPSRLKAARQINRFRYTCDGAAVAYIESA